MSDWLPPDPSPADQHGIRVALKGAFGADAEDVADELGLSFDFILPAAEEYGASRGAEMIGKKLVNGMLVDNPNAEWVISDWTRERANAMLSEALSEGWSYQSFSSRLEDSGLFDGARADLVARNEIALAMAGGKAASFHEAGVEYVYIYDGDFDEECAARDGTIVSLDEWEAQPYMHPNCTADARPATQEEIADELGEEDNADAQAEEAA
jgi:SPP1 gp7 family putative phage head morphogenesis protein